MLSIHPSRETVFNVKKIWLVSVMSTLSIVLLLAVVSVISALSDRAILKASPNGSFSENGTTDLVMRFAPKLLVPLCCQLHYRATKEGCVEAIGTVNRFPPLYRSGDMALLDGAPTTDSFRFVVNNPCNDRFRLEPDKYPDDRFMFLDNGTIYKPVENVLLERNFCFARMESDEYVVLVCFDEEEVQDDNTLSIGMIVSAPFLLATLLVYTVIPELRNLHGLTLRGYVSCLFIGYTLIPLAHIAPEVWITDPVCVAFAFIIHFSFLASFFWLNVMCFDIWWTFGGFRSLQGSVKQRERKKFVIYSIYAWGSATILTCICILMEYLPNIPENFIRPQFGVGSCWFGTDQARAIYFYGPMGITVFCNICLFVSTAVKIIKHKKDTANHLRGADSRRHDDNKQWFSLYLKLFIVMGISWSMEIISWLFNNSPRFIWYLTDLTNTLQGVLIFLIFVWKDKIRRLLLKKFGCHGSNVVSRNSTRSAYHSSTSRTGTSTVQTAVPTNVSSTPASATTTISAATTTLLQEKGNEPLPLQEDNLKLSEYNGHCF
ncbi:G-protein coupled receptor Mth2 isoform X2 [Nomia melanderi]|uniref:G-protein coupled receptor Mth2 isoform X2 n=1 Tax=Nomia melanderi TaxID=2448451 RepID=UPI003FCC7601